MKKCEIKLKYCNKCPYFFTGNDIIDDSHLCLNIKIGDPDGCEVPIENKIKKKPDGFHIEYFWKIPKWCPLDDVEEDKKMASFDEIQWK